MQKLIEFYIIDCNFIMNVVPFHEVNRSKKQLLYENGAYLIGNRAATIVSLHYDIEGMLVLAWKGFTYAK